MSNKRRDTILWIGVVLGEIGLLIAWYINGLGSLLRIGDLRFSGMWQTLALLGGTIFGYAIINLWLIARGKFHWSREGLASVIIPFLVWTILFPVYPQVFQHVRHSRPDYPHPSRVTED
jgi:hypothetical protein